MDISVSILGPGTKELMNQGDFHAEGDSKLLLKGVSPNLQKKAINQACNKNHGNAKTRSSIYLSNHG
jgi:hypothetical protein